MIQLWYDAEIIEIECNVWLRKDSFNTFHGLDYLNNKFMILYYYRFGSKHMKSNFPFEANQNKNSCLVCNLFNKFKFRALFSVRNRWKKSSGDSNLS